MKTNIQIEEATKQVYDFNTWLEAEYYTSYEDYNHMNKQERASLRRQYDAYVKSVS